MSRAIPRRSRLELTPYCCCAAGLAGHIPTIRPGGQQRNATPRAAPKRRTSRLCGCCFCVRLLFFYGCFLVIEAHGESVVFVFLLFGGTEQSKVPKIIFQGSFFSRCVHPAPLPTSPLCATSGQCPPTVMGVRTTRGTTPS